MAVTYYRDPETGEFRKIQAPIGGGGVDIPISETEPEKGNYWIDLNGTGGSGGNGGGSGFCPQIVCAIEAESVTCVKGDIVLEAVLIDGFWTCDVTEYGNWSVIIDGEWHETVNVSDVKQYVVSPYKQLVNYKMLYEAGNEYPEETGGWEQTFTVQSDTRYTPTYTEYADNIYIKGQGANVSMGTANAVDLSGIAECWIYAKRVGSHTTGLSRRFAIGTQKGVNMATVGSNGSLAVNTVSTNTTAVTEYEKLVVPDETTAAYVQITVVSENAQSSETNLYKCFAVKADDWATLAEKAGISASSINDILAESGVLFESQDAVEFMLRQCTGSFMVAAVLSSTFLAALAASPNASLVYASLHWSRFLSWVA